MTPPDMELAELLLSRATITITPPDREQALLLLADDCKSMQADVADLCALADFISE